jgi:hypothetical protein
VVKADVTKANVTATLPGVETTVLLNVPNTARAVKQLANVLYVPMDSTSIVTSIASLVNESVLLVDLFLIFAKVAPREKN